MGRASPGCSQSVSPLFPLSPLPGSPLTKHPASHELCRWQEKVIKTFDLMILSATNNLHINSHPPSATSSDHPPTDNNNLNYFMCLFEVAARGCPSPSGQTGRDQGRTGKTLGAPWVRFSLLVMLVAVVVVVGGGGDTMKQTIIQEWFAVELQSWSVIIIS